MRGARQGETTKGEVEQAPSEETMSRTGGTSRTTEEETALLEAALSQCRALCDTPETLTSVYRQRVRRDGPGPQQIQPTSASTHPSHATRRDMRSPPFASLRPALTLSTSEDYRAATSAAPNTPTTVIDDTTEQSLGEFRDPAILVLGPRSSVSTDQQSSTSAFR